MEGDESREFMQVTSIGDLIEKEEEEAYHITAAINGEGLRGKVDSNKQKSYTSCIRR